jgi:site-specific DNA recombinase
MKAEQGRRRAALYARYSTDKQSEMSVEDQFRVSERIANREGFEVVARFEDRAITGGTSARPGYQAMLDGARLRHYDAIVAEDLKRLWREQAEQWRCIKELIDLDMCVITASGVDSRQPNFEIIASVIGAAAELDRKEASYRTRRGLEGLAVAGKSTGRKAYGYVAARDSSTGRVEIKEAEAATVVRIFEMYASGLSPRSIAGRLNAEGVPSPGASWSRKASGRNSKRRSKWVASAIHGDVRRGTGILNNERYIGRMNWGRSHWKRGAADSSKRVNRLIEDRSQWVTHEEPRLRIIPGELWNRVSERQAIMAAGAVRIRAARMGRPATSLLSGLLVCASCGSRFIAVDQSFYGCASLKQGGLAACTNTARVRRSTMEQRILAEIEAEILSDEALERVKTGLQSLLLARPGNGQQQQPTSPRLAKLQEEAQELRTLEKKGRLSSLAARAALDAIEYERAELVSRASRDDRRIYEEAMKAIPQSAALYRAAVHDLNKTLTDPTERAEARALIAELLGQQVKIRQDGESVFARLEIDEAVLVASKIKSLRNKDFQNGSGGRI